MITLLSLSNLRANCAGRVAATALRQQQHCRACLPFKQGVFKAVGNQILSYQKHKIMFKTWLNEYHLIKYHLLQKWEKLKIGNSKPSVFAQTTIQYIFFF